MRPALAPTEQEALAYMRKAAEAMSRHPWVERAWLFGSYARGEQTEASDLDLLLQCAPTTYFKVLDLKFELEALFQKKTDLVTTGGLSPHVQPYIDRDKILFYMKNQALGDKARIAHMLEAAEDAIAFVAGQSYEAYAADYKLRLASVKLIEIIGEAASAISPETKNRHPQVAWRSAIGMRNIAVHEYFGIDYPIVWKTILDDLPALVQQLKTILAAW